MLMRTTNPQVGATSESAYITSIGSPSIEFQVKIHDIIFPCDRPSRVSFLNDGGGDFDHTGLVQWDQSKVVYAMQ